MGGAIANVGGVTTSIFLETRHLVEKAPQSWNLPTEDRDYMGVDDVGLLGRARRGDEAAFSALFSRYQRVIYRYAAYMCGPDAGDDIVQETFMDDRSEEHTSELQSQR